MFLFLWFFLIPIMFIWNSFFSFNPTLLGLMIWRHRLAWSQWLPNSLCSQTYALFSSFFTSCPKSSLSFFSSSSLCASPRRPALGTVTPRKAPDYCGLFFFSLSLKSCSKFLILDHRYTQQWELGTVSFCYCPFEFLLAYTF